MQQQKMQTGNFLTKKWAENEEFSQNLIFKQL